MEKNSLLQKYCKKMFITIFLMLVLVFASSCKKIEEMSIYDEFAIRFNEVHKDGYKIGPRWYEFTSTNIEYNNLTKNKIIEDQYYIGELDLEQNKLEGNSKVCKFKSTRIELVNNEVTKKTEELMLLNNNTYFSSKNVYLPESDEQIYESKGSKNISFASTKFDIYEDIFNPDVFEMLLSINWLYEEIKIEDNYVRFITHYPKNRHQEDTITEYWFDENFVLYQVRRTRSMTIDSENETEEKYNYINIATLKLVDSIEIDVPEEYEEEYKNQWDFISFYL